MMFIYFYLFIANKRIYNTGEIIEMYIILRDGNGKDRTRGGDKLRVRMFNTTQQAFVAGHVTDHRNGSYTATVPALWPGKQKISMLLAYTREAIRAIYYIRKKVPKMTFINWQCSRYGLNPITLILLRI